MKNYSRKKSTKNKTAFRTPSRYVAQKAQFKNQKGNYIPPSVKK